MYMQGLANFLDDFLGGLILISYALVVGSLIWAAWILRIWSAVTRASDAVAARSVALLRIVRSRWPRCRASNWSSRD